MTDFDKEVLEDISSRTLKKFRGYVFVPWSHGRESLVLFLYYINTLYLTEKRKFTMEVAEPGN